MSKEMRFFKKLSNKHGEELLDSATKTRLNAAKSASEKVVHKTPEAREKLIGNKDTATKACT